MPGELYSNNMYIHVHITQFMKTTKGKMHSSIRAQLYTIYRTILNIMTLVLSHRCYIEMLHAWGVTCTLINVSCSIYCLSMIQPYVPQNMRCQWHAVAVQTPPQYSLFAILLFLWSTLLNWLGLQTVMKRWIEIHRVQRLHNHNKNLSIVKWSCIWDKDFGNGVVFGIIFRQKVCLWCTHRTI